MSSHVQITLFFVIGLFSLFIIFSPLVSLGSTLKIYPPDSDPYGLSYGQWSQKWWEWAFEVPSEDSPVNDVTGENCSLNQEGPVWFLAGTFGTSVTRECIIPEGKALFMPADNVPVSVAEFKNLPDDEQVLKAEAEKIINDVDIVEVEIDGVKIENITSYKVITDLFQLDLPQANVLGAEPGTYNFTGAGHWVFIDPLSPGKHTVLLRAVTFSPELGNPETFISEAKYNLLVASNNSSSNP